MRRAAHSNRLAHLQTILREAREAAGLRQADVAERLDQPQSFVSKYESGDRCLDLIELEQVCEAIELPLGTLVERFEGRH